MNDEIVVKVQGLGKKFKLYNSPQDRLREWLSFGGVVKHSDFWAIKDISLEVKRGECLGIIGENGAGKSTLLKILTGALWPTTGSMKMKGRVLSLLELGTGFNVELTGKQNVFNSASLLGFPEDYINAERMSLIEEFADIGEFFDRPVRTYSSGMHVRLAFSMFMFMEPEIFIIDEALSVGDIFFSQKCFTRIREQMDNGVTFIFVSHDLNAVQNLSSRVILLNNGECIFQGKPEQAIERYSTKSSSNTSSASSATRLETEPTSVIKNDDQIARVAIESNSVLDGKHRHGHGGMEIVAARIVDSSNSDTLAVPLMEDLYFYFLIKAKKEIQNPLVHGIKVKMSLQPGQYTASFHCGEPDSSNINPNAGKVCDWHDSIGPINVTFDYSANRVPFNGIADLSMTIIE
jgi:ABC-type polysaccharide/polyol phosphate transport system ATPase subunit